MEQPSLHPDIALAVSNTASDDLKYRLLTTSNHAHIPEMHKFPQITRYNRPRSFLRKWLTTHSWLVYSQSMQGAFCRVCVLFSSQTPGVGQLVKTKLVELERGNKVCVEHSQKKYHLNALTAAEDFLRTYQDHTQTIISKLNEQQRKSAEIMHKGVKSIVKSVAFLARQGMPFRGHRSESFSAQNLALYDSDTLSSTCNSGLFLELIKLLCSRDEDLRCHLEKSALNRKYISKTSQERILSLLAAQVLEHITEVMFDECTDVSTTEQMAVVVRYASKPDSGAIQVHEKFLAMIECDTGTTGRAIADKITGLLLKLNLDPEGFKAIATDGAGNMCGAMRGAATLLSESYPGLTHIHCYSHILNLSIMAACKIQSVQNMMDTVRSIHSFFNQSAKRTDLLLTTLSTAPVTPETRRRKIKDVCRTRWVERYDALDTMVCLLPYVVECFEEITANSTLWSQETKTQAAGLLHRLSTFSFIISLTVCSGVLSITKGLCIQLQSRGFDLYQATR